MARIHHLLSDAAHLDLFPGAAGSEDMKTLKQCGTGELKGDEEKRERGILQDHDCHYCAGDTGNGLAMFNE